MARENPLGISIFRSSVSSDPQFRDLAQNDIRPLIEPFDLLGDSIFTIMDMKNNNTARTSGIAESLGIVALGVASSNNQAKEVAGWNGNTEITVINSSIRHTIPITMFTLLTQGLKSPRTELNTLREINDHLENLDSPIRLPITPQDNIYKF